MSLKGKCRKVNIEYWKVCYGVKKRKKKELMQCEIWYIPAEAQYYCSYCELHPKAEYLALEHR